MLDTQQDVSVAGHPKNHIYINSGEFIHILFNPELLGGLIQQDRVIMFQAGCKPIHFSLI